MTIFKRDCGDGDSKEKILIEYTAIDSIRKPGQGWSGVYWVNGRGHTLWQCLDRDEALASARKEALDEAARYIGDGWEITVEEYKGDIHARNT